MNSTKVLLSEIARSSTLCGISVGTQKEAVEGVFGCAAESGAGTQKVLIESYAERKVQITYVGRQVVLIAVYLPLGANRSLHVGGVELVDDLPMQVSDDIARYADWLGGDPVIQKWDESSGVVRAQSGAVAVFDNGQLTSLQAS